MSDRDRSEPRVPTGQLSKYYRCRYVYCVVRAITYEEDEVAFGVHVSLAEMYKQGLVGITFDGSEQLYWVTDEGRRAKDLK